MVEFEMRLIKLQRNSTLKPKFTDLRFDMENIERIRVEKVVPERSVENGLLRTWNAIPKSLKSKKMLQPHYSPYFQLHMFVNLCYQL